MNETIKIILGIINSLKNIENVSGNELSEDAVKLAIHKVYVGQELVKLEYELSHNRMVRKTEWGKTFSVATGTVDQKKISADDEVRELVLGEIELERKVAMLKNLRIDISDVVSTIQTRLAQLRSEMSES